MELRCNKKSTILCSQWTPEGWYQKLGGGPIADAILDRIINSSYKYYWRVLHERRIFKTQIAKKPVCLDWLS